MVFDLGSFVQYLTFFVQYLTFCLQKVAKYGINSYYDRWLSYLNVKFLLLSASIFA